MAFQYCKQQGMDLITVDSYEKYKQRALNCIHTYIFSALWYKAALHVIEQGGRTVPTSQFLDFRHRFG